MNNSIIKTVIITLLSFSFPVVSTAQNYQEIWAKVTVPGTGISKGI